MYIFQLSLLQLLPVIVILKIDCLRLFVVIYKLVVLMLCRW